MDLQLKVDDSAVVFYGMNPKSNDFLGYNLKAFQLPNVFHSDYGFVISDVAFQPARKILSELGEMHVPGLRL